MTDTAQKVYDYLVGRENNIPPSVREICEATGFKSTSTVHRALKALESQGLIVLEGRSARGIALTKSESAKTADNASQIAVFESIADFMQGKTDNSLDFELSTDKLFILKIRSSNDFEFLKKGDLLLCERTSKAKNGDIVIVDLGRQVLLRRYYKTSEFLEFNNDSVEPPMTVLEAKIMAKAVGTVNKIERLI